MSDIAELRRWLENEVDAGDEAVQVWADKARSIEEQLEAAQAAYESERNTAMYLDGILAKHHETTGWNCPVCYPASEPEAS